MQRCPIRRNASLERGVVRRTTFDSLWQAGATMDMYELILCQNVLGRPEMKR